MTTHVNPVRRHLPGYPDDAFGRIDESDDTAFYSRDRFVNHLDDTALATVTALIGDLVIEERPVILDLMAGWDSHLPADVRPSKLIGLGLNRNELARNEALTDRVIHDLNLNPRLPFANASFDVVLNTVSVDYMTQPLAIFTDVARILRPGGLFLVVFSNRMFRQKAVNIWRSSSEDERLLLVEDFFRAAGLYTSCRTFISRGLPRPQDDKYAHLGLPSDPIYAVYADRQGSRATLRPEPRPAVVPYNWSDEEIAARKIETGKTLRCPYCNANLSKWQVPQTPFTEWSNEFMYICFNDSCPYFIRGWTAMNRQGNTGMSYRMMYNPERDCCLPIPVPSRKALKSAIVEESA